MLDAIYSQQPGHDLVVEGSYGAYAASDLLCRQVEILADMPGVEVRACQARSLELAFDPQVIAAPALIATITAAHAVEDLRLDQPAIEEVIARFYDLHGALEA